MTYANGVNPLAVGFLLIPSNWHGDIFLQTLTWHGLLFSMFTVWHGFFSLVLMFPGLRIEALPPSTVRGKCIYTFFKAKNQEIQLPLVCTKPSTDQNMFWSFKGRWSVVPGRFIGLTCSWCPSAHYQFYPFVGLTCHNSRIERADLAAPMPIRQDFLADLSAYHSQRVNRQTHRHIHTETDKPVAIVNFCSSPKNKNWICNCPWQIIMAN